MSSRSMTAKRRTTKDQARLRELEELARAMGAVVRYDDVRGSTRSSGGICRVRDAWWIIVDRRMAPRERATMLERQLDRLRQRLERAGEVERMERKGSAAAGGAGEPASRASA
ncbi:MAG: hypothetical protein D6705_05915 [Deltaproteobacteria bacterium]|nr:MAG: hypothetical protein D6705_05915 [Deltaproteobacteria bacterium]